MIKKLITIIVLSLITMPLLAGTPCAGMGTTGAVSAHNHSGHMDKMTHERQLVTCDAVSNKQKHNNHCAHCYESTHGISDTYIITIQFEYTHQAAETEIIQEHSRTKTISVNKSQTEYATVPIHINNLVFRC